MSTKLTYTGAEVQELLDKIEKGDFDNAKTLEGHPASYFAIASEFTPLAEAFATEQGRINTLYSYFNNGSANDALRLGGQLPSYYATATQYEILQRTLSDFKSLFDSMFEKDSGGNIHAKLSLWSSGGITAGGVGSGGSGGGGISYNRLDSWSDYSADKAGYVLSAALGYDINTRLTSVENAGYVTASALAPYVLRSEVEGQYLSKNGGTVNGSITATSFIGNLTGTADRAFTQSVLYGNRDVNLWDTDASAARYFALTDATPNTPSGVYALGSILMVYSWDANAGAQLLSHNRGNNIFYRSRWNGAFKDWREIAFTDSNVASAAKLATPRTIWGQSFDGTGNITGALTAPSITANSITIGGATITYDSVNEALCINGNMYALGGITAGGAGISAYTSLESRVARLEQQLNI